MPVDLADLVDPTHTALVTQELQRGVAGDLSALPELAEAARPTLPIAAALVAAARAAGAAVIHCTAERRADGLGANRNAPIFRYMAKAPGALLQGSDAVAMVPEIPLDDSDLTLPRLHGLSPFQGTELDSVLRNRGISTVVTIGVSVNIAIQNLAFDAVNAGYHVVIPRDAVAGVPTDYVDAVFAHTLGNVATVVGSGEILALWGADRPG